MHEQQPIPNSAEIAGLREAIAGKTFSQYSDESKHLAVLVVTGLIEQAVKQQGVTMLAMMQAGCTPEVAREASMFNTELMLTMLIHLKTEIDPAARKAAAPEATDG